MARLSFCCLKRTMEEEEEEEKKEEETEAETENDLSEANIARLFPDRFELAYNYFHPTSLSYLPRAVSNPDETIMDLSDDESIPNSSTPKNVSKEVSDRLDSCFSAWDDIEDPNPEDYSYETEPIGFDMKLVFGPWLSRSIPAWPVGSLQDDFSDESWVDAYRQVDKGPPILAFICRQGVIVAGARVHLKVIQFNSHVIGCIAGDVADPDFFLRDLRCEGTALDVSKWLQTHSSLIGKDLFGIVIAGWNEEGPSLYRLDYEGKLHQGVLFASGSCSRYAYRLVGLKCFPYMSITTAARLARIAIPTAMAKSKFDDGIDDSESEDFGVFASENSKIGDSVEVHCVARDGYIKVDGGVVNAVREADGEA